MLPEAFLERMRGMLGEEYGAFLESFRGEHARGLSLNPRKIGIDGRSAAERFGVHGAAEGENILGFAGLTGVPWARNGYYYRSCDQPGKHPFHDAGLYYIQEPSAMMPVGLMDIQPGERILDLCAAPGGKSVQIAAGLQGSGVLVCNEIHPARAKILSENIERMGIGNACVLNETPERLAEVFAGYFDRILVDAPCSGEGMFRRNEAACGEWSQEHVELCAARQDGILDCAAAMLRAGGRMVYSTCTFAPEEDEGSVSRFLRRHGEFGILPGDKERLGLLSCHGVPGYIDDPAPGLEGAVRLWPHRVRGEGHFAAVLGKEGIFLEGIRDYDRKSAVKRTSGESDRAVPAEFLLFCEENLSVSREDVPAGLGRITGLGGALRFLNFGDNLYLAPADMPSLKGLKVLRPGLHLGETKKNRFEPSHALALALAPGAAAHVRNLSSDDPAVSAYLGGQTFPAEGEKGWYLICVDGFGLGWGKLAAGSMKNHYPRGLRR